MAEKLFEKVEDWAAEFKDFNKELEERILEANQDTSKVKWNKLLPDLMGADVFIAGQYSEGAQPGDGRVALNILTVQRDGRNIIPFFTSPERVSAVVGGAVSKLDIMKVNLVRLFNSIAGKQAFMNPNSPYSRAFTPFEMRILAAENADKCPPLEGVDNDGEDSEDGSEEKA